MAGKVTEDDSCFLQLVLNYGTGQWAKNELELESKESIHLSSGCAVSSVCLPGPSFSLLFHSGDRRALLTFPVPEFQTHRVL